MRIPVRFNPQGARHERSTVTFVPFVQNALKRRLSVGCPRWSFSKLLSLYAWPWVLAATPSSRRVGRPCLFSVPCETCDWGWTAHVRKRCLFVKKKDEGYHPGFRESLLIEINHLRRYAHALLGSRDYDSADDLVHDCLERALTHQSSWQRGTNLRAWLFRILHNLYVTRVRASARSVEVPSHPNQPEPSVDDGSRSDIEVIDLERALDQLPFAHREVLVLVAIEGLSYQEAADIIQVPVGTVRSRLSRARETLCALLERPDI